MLEIGLPDYIREALAEPYLVENPEAEGLSQTLTDVLNKVIAANKT